MEIIVLDIDLKWNQGWAVKFLTEPAFDVSGFIQYDLGDDHVSAFVEILRQIMTWRIRNRDTVMLMPSSLLNADWTALFCYYVKYFEEDKVVSMCGPIEGFHLEPIEPDFVKLYRISNNIRTRAEKYLFDQVDAMHIPNKNTWDWKTAIAVAYLFWKDDFDFKFNDQKATEIVF